MKLKKFAEWKRKKFTAEEDQTEEDREDGWMCFFSVEMK